MQIKIAWIVVVLIIAKFYLVGLQTSLPGKTQPQPQSQAITFDTQGLDVRSQWALEFLHLIGNDAPTHEIMGVVVAWQGGENTEAKFNPLATTQSMEGDDCFNYTKEGRCLVRDYPNYATGMQASVITITNARYPHILHGLQTNDVEEAINDAELGTWGTGGSSVRRGYNEWLSTQSDQQTLVSGNYTAPPLQVAGAGCLEPNVTSAYNHSPGLQQIDIPPGTDWSFNDHWIIADDLVACAGQSFTGGGVCNQASRYSNVARNLGLLVQSQYHGYIYDQAVPSEDNLAIMSSGERGGQDLVIGNPTNRSVHISAVLIEGHLIVSGGFTR